MRKVTISKVTHPFRQANDRPHWATEGAATAEATTEKPANVDGQVFPEGSVDPAHCGFELLGSNSGVKGGREIGVKPIGKPESVIKKEGRYMYWWSFQIMCDSIL